VFVNFIPVADLTYLPAELFDILKKDAIMVSGILYAPPNYLRMSMYLELSRPAGDTDRWEKVFKRLSLLNKHFPLTETQCATIDFQREIAYEQEEGDEIYDSVKKTLINQSVVFFGGYAISVYAKYMPKHLQKRIEKIPDFDVLSNDPETTAEIVKERLKDIGITNVKIIKREPVGEIIPVHYEIVVGKDTIVFLYKPIGCHSYNSINIDGQKVRIATIDTMLSFYLAFLYADRPYYDPDRIICMSKFLFDVEEKNRLEQKGVLRRFSITCYGHQPSIEEMRAEKSEKYNELKDKKGSREFEEYFLAYRPDGKIRNKKKIQNKKPVKKQTKKQTNKTKKTRNKLFDPYNAKSRTKKYM
jgi:hypothetical protein